MQNRVEIKAEAKRLVRSGKTSPLLVTMIVMAIQAVLERVVNLVTYGTMFPEQVDMAVMQQMLNRGVTDIESILEAVEASGAVASTSLTATFFSILVNLFMTVLLGGYLTYLMGIRRNLTMPCTTLLDGLGIAGKLIWADILMSVKVFLWSMLFVIPGVIASYRYRFVKYNLLTDESMSVREAFALSKQQTKGMKMDLFVLDLSFIGWNILNAFSMGLVNIWLMPYANLCDLAYFEQAQRRLGREPYGSAAEDPWNSQSNW